MKVSVKNLKNESVREIELPEEVFGYPYKEHLIHVVVEAYRSGLQRGTHAVKNRGEVSGSNKKPFRQKGTGRARAGETRSPLWRKGGTVHGSTDEFGAAAVQDKVHVHDLHATPGRRLVVVAPTSHLKVQWADAAARFGLHIEPRW